MTPITGTTTEYVASSWIDMLAGLSQCWTFRTPPYFCAIAGAAAAVAAHTTHPRTARRLLLIGFLPLRSAPWEQGTHLPRPALFTRSEYRETQACHARVG